MAFSSRLRTVQFAILGLGIPGCYAQPSTEDTGGTETEATGATSAGPTTMSTAASSPDDGDDGIDDGIDDGMPTSTTGSTDDTTGDTGPRGCTGANETVLADWTDSLCSTVDIYSCDGANECGLIECNLGPADPGGWVRLVDPATGEGVDLSPALEMGTVANDGARATADLVVGGLGDACSPRFVTQVACAGGDTCSATFTVRIYDAAGDFSAPLDMMTGIEVADGDVTEVDIALAPYQDVAQLYVELEMNTDTWDPADVLLLQQPRIVGTD